jgi:hypothetical protein
MLYHVDGDKIGPALRRKRHVLTAGEWSDAFNQDRSPRGSYVKYQYGGLIHRCLTLSPLVWMKALPLALEARPMENDLNSNVGA